MRAYIPCASHLAECKVSSWDSLIPGPSQRYDSNPRPGGYLLRHCIPVHPQAKIFNTAVENQCNVGKYAASLTELRCYATRSEW
jgi:hypothetical protein